MVELRECPFCEGEAYLETIPNLASNEYVVRCKNKKCLGFYIGYGDVGLYGTKDGAIKAWNTRKPVERILERLEEKVAECKERAKEELNEFCLEMFHAYEDEADGIKKAIEIIKEEVGQIEETHN